MNKNLVWRGILLLLVVGGGLFYLLPTLLSNDGADEGSQGFLSKILPKKMINLGLDLKGGIYLAMEVDLQVAVNNAIHRHMEDLRRRLNDAKVTGFRLENVNSPEIVMTLTDPAATQASANDVLNRYFSETLRVVSNDGGKSVLAFTADAQAELEEITARQALETIRNRIDMYGVAEPDIRPQAGGRIIIQLPGVSNPQEAIDLIGKTAILEFKLVDNGSISPQEALRVGPPPGTEVLYEKVIDPRTGAETREPLLLRKQPEMTGENLVDSRVVRGQQFGEPQVTLTFNSRGAREFDDLTSKYVGRRLAIVLDNQVYGAPTIKVRIPDGEAYIDNLGLDEARVLSVALRAGALPAPVTVIEKRTVGPSMGQDSIRHGFSAGVVGLCLILVFMLFYYRLSGIVADLALVFNFPIVLGALAAFGATLTLPGIFGLVLTLAMAVDANVLIFERIREEIRSGKSAAGAIKGGFDRAFWTIFDSNITTILAAMVLYQFGSGPIRGFAVTLIIGILSSMFTSIFASRWVFDLVLYNRQKIKTVSI